MRLKEKTSGGCYERSEFPSRSRELTLKNTEVVGGKVKSAEEKSFIFTSDDVKNFEFMNVEFTSSQHVEDVDIVLFLVYLYIYLVRN